MNEIYNLILEKIDNINLKLAEERLDYKTADTDAILDKASE